MVKIPNNTTKAINPNRGQGAMEYLMTYGWAILVVMMVGVAMWQLGVFNMGTSTVSTTGFTKIKPLVATSGFFQDGSGNITFVNGVGTPVNIISIIVKDLGNGSFIKNVTLDNSTIKPSSLVEKGSIFIFSPGTNTILAGAPGATYNVKIEVTYRTTLGGTSSTHTDMGTIRGLYE
jgi:hypothetical protein